MFNIHTWGCVLRLKLSKKNPRPTSCVRAQNYMEGEERGGGRGVSGSHIFRVSQKPFEARVQNHTGHHHQQQTEADPLFIVNCERADTIYSSRRCRPRSSHEFCSMQVQSSNARCIFKAPMFKAFSVLQETCFAIFTPERSQKQFQISSKGTCHRGKLPYLMKTSPDWRWIETSPRAPA